MKKALFLIAAAVFTFALSGCATTSGASSSQSASSSQNTDALKKTAVNALLGTGKNTWFKTVSGNYVYYILYSDSAVTSGIRSDVTINKGLTILVTTSSENPVNGLTSSTFVVKSFGQTATESADGSSQTFTLNDSAWSYFYTMNSAAMTALSSVPEQLKAANSSKYTNLAAFSAKDFNWKQVLVNYLAGSL